MVTGVDQTTGGATNYNYLNLAEKYIRYENPERGLSDL
jgi:hypothetical protein